MKPRRVTTAADAWEPGTRLQRHALPPQRSRRSRRRAPAPTAVVVGARAFLALALSVPACVPELLRPSEADSTPEVRIPLRVENGLPLVEGRVPGRPGEDRVWFLIDSGAGDFTLLDEKLSTQLRLKHDLVRDPLLPSIDFSARLPFLEVDGMGRRDLTVYVTDLPPARPELRDLSVPVQGVLGAGYFLGQCLWFDWGKGEFTATRARRMLKRHVPIPLRFGLGGELHATIRVHGIEAEALVDTGSSRTLVAQEFADKVGLAYERAGVALHRETSIGPVATRDGVIERLSLGTGELSNVSVLIVERRLPRADLVLGTDVLSRYGVILDLAERPYLVLDPVEGEAGPEPTPPAPASQG